MSVAHNQKIAQNPGSTSLMLGLVQQSHPALDDSTPSLKRETVESRYGTSGPTYKGKVEDSSPGQTPHRCVQESFKECLRTED